jgi:hypothetical protein
VDGDARKERGFSRQALHFVPALFVPDDHFLYGMLPVRVELILQST